MDKVMSTRLDESIVCLIDQMSHQLKMSKKKFLEDAVRCYIDRIKTMRSVDVFAETCGVWNRSESPEELLDKGREAFEKNL